MNTEPTAPVFCALDTKDIPAALSLARAVSPYVAGLKLGLEFFYAAGTTGYRTLAAEGLPIFLDVKLHDIPNTVAGAVRSLTPLQPAFITVHAAGGEAMMAAALDAAGDAAARLGVDRPKLLAVTVLTSLEAGDLTAIGQDPDALAQATRLAGLARKAGIDGIVCSPWEIEIIRRTVGPEAEIVVPGIRPAGAAADDQKRVRTPPEAIAAGATRLVIGRPITAAADPGAAARAIADSLVPALPGGHSGENKGLQS